MKAQIRGDLGTSGNHNVIQSIAALLLFPPQSSRERIPQSMLSLRMNLHDQPVPSSKTTATTKQHASCLSSAGCWIGTSTCPSLPKRPALILNVEVSGGSDLIHILSKCLPSIVSVRHLAGWLLITHFAMECASSGILSTRFIAPILNESYWSLMYYSWTGMAIGWSTLLLGQYILGLSLGMQSRDSLIMCGITGTFLVECVPIASGLVCFCLWLIRGLEFEQCVTISLTFSSMSCLAAIVLRRIVSATLYNHSTR